jgi:hypothetical protein
LLQGVARTTLAPPTYIKRSPSDHYKAGPTPAPTEDPYRFIQRKLGISAKTFEERIAQDVDDLLQELADEKCASTPPTQQEAGPSECAILKDKCYRMLRDKELTSGSMLGMFKWAADLGRARVQFRNELGRREH